MSPFIESPSNRRIVTTARLRQRRQRDRTGRFLVEGTREVRRAIAAGATIVEAFVGTAYASSAADHVAEALADSAIPTTAVSAAAFDKLSHRQSPDGIVAVAETWEAPLERLTVDLVLIAEAIEKPGNLGAMLRTADATGAGLLIADPNVDPFNPNVVRASQGALFSAPFAVSDTPAAIAWARDRGSVFVATPDAAKLYWAANLTGRTAIVIGSEHGGIGEAWRTAGRSVRIPMAGEADSLNASVTAGVVLFEAVRQRHRTT